MRRTRGLTGPVFNICGSRATNNTQLSLDHHHGQWPYICCQSPVSHRSVMLSSFIGNIIRVTRPLQAGCPH
ncbi:hypothetical protein AB3S75_037141 [Citrus x aurantiifolia]